MSALTYVYLIWFLLVASAVMLGIGILAGIGWCIWKAWEWFATRRKKVEAVTDDQIKRGYLLAEEIDELLKPRYGPVSQRDFRITERGRPIHFEDDHGSAA